MTAAAVPSLTSSAVSSNELLVGSRETAIYVITLPSAVNRQRMFRDSANQQKVTRDWHFFNGYTALSPALRYNTRRALVARGRSLHHRELACYSSHYEAWRAFLESEARQLVVMEDDVLLDWAFLERVIRDDLSSNGVDYLKFFSKNMTPYHVVSNNFHGRWLLNCRGFAYGMQAYLLTRAGAKRFIAHCGDVVRPIDDELDRSWAHGVPNLTVFPFPALELSGPSSIGADRDQFKPLPLSLQWGRRFTQVRERALRFRQKVTGYGLARELPAYSSRRFGTTHVQQELL